MKIPRQFRASYQIVIASMSLDQTSVSQVGNGSDRDGSSQQTVADELYRLTFKVTVKPYVNAQYRSSVALGDKAINCSTVESFSSAIHDLVSENVAGQALLSEVDGVRRYSLQEGPIELNNLNGFVIIKHSNHFYSINDPSERQHGTTRTSL